MLGLKDTQQFCILPTRDGSKHLESKTESPPIKSFQWIDLTALNADKCNNIKLLHQQNDTKVTGCKYNSTTPAWLQVSYWNKEYLYIYIQSQIQADEDKLSSSDNFFKCFC